MAHPLGTGRILAALPGLCILLAAAVLLGGALRSCTPEAPEDGVEPAMDEAVPEDSEAPEGQGFSLHPEQPTSAHVTYVEWGLPDRGQPTRQADRLVGLRVFYAVHVGGAQEAARYRLGVLAPGEYEFVLLRQDGVVGCSYEEVDAFSFVVPSPSGEQDELMGSGFIRLLVESTARDDLEIALAAERPQVEISFGLWGYAVVPPGMEVDYQRAMAASEEIESAELDVLAATPECAVDLGPAYRPGRVVLKFRSAPDERTIADFAERLPPLLAGWAEGGSPVEGEVHGSTSAAVVRVLPGREMYFLERLLHYPSVLDGGIISSWEDEEE